MGGVKSLLARLLEPYQGASGRRVLIEGDDAIVGPNAATALALVFHELSTNAVKYGALSTDDGSVYVAVELWSWCRRSPPWRWRSTLTRAIEVQVAS